MIPILTCLRYDFSMHNGAAVTGHQLFICSNASKPYQGCEISFQSLLKCRILKSIATPISQLAKFSLDKQFLRKKSYLFADAQTIIHISRTIPVTTITELQNRVINRRTNLHFGHFHIQAGCANTSPMHQIINLIKKEEERKRSGCTAGTSNEGQV